MVTSFSSACLFSQLSDESEEEVEDDGALQTYNTRDMYGDRWPLCQEIVGEENETPSQKW